jgi:hypothetical protein
MAEPQLHEVLFEFRPVGRFVKVMAIDPITGTEISVVGDATATPDTLKRIAINKLKYVLSRGTVRNDPRTRDDNLY